MPCPPRMRGCRASCLHRQLVNEYRDARDAYEATLEDTTSLYPAEVRDYKRDYPGPTFKAWLQGHAGHREMVEDERERGTEVA